MKRIVRRHLIFFIIMFLKTIINLKTTFQFYKFVIINLFSNLKENINSFTLYLLISNIFEDVTGEKHQANYVKLSSFLYCNNKISNYKTKENTIPTQANMFSFLSINNSLSKKPYYT